MASATFGVEASLPQLLMPLIPLMPLMAVRGIKNMLDSPHGLLSDALV